MAIAAMNREMLSLDSIALTPALAKRLTPKQARLLSARLEVARGLLRARRIELGEDLVELANVPNAPAGPSTPDRMLKVVEAAQLLGIAKDTLYRNADEYPFTRRVRPRCLRFSELGIQDWLALKKRPDEWR